MLAEEEAAFPLASVVDETDVSATLYPSHIEATSSKFAISGTIAKLLVLDAVIIVVDGAAANGM